MSGNARSYKTGLYRRLQDNAYVKMYLEVALEDSPSAFLVALRDVAEARNISKVARESKTDRAHLYRTLSETGNPTLSSLERILHAIGLRLAIDEIEHAPVDSRKAGWHVLKPIQSCHSVKFKYVNPNKLAHSGGEILPGCAQTISAPMENSRELIPHPAFVPDAEKVYEMAY